MSNLSDAIGTTQETGIISGSTTTSWWSSSVRFHFMMILIVLGVTGTAGNMLILYALVASKQYKKYLLIVNQNVLDLYTCVFLVITFSLRYSLGPSNITGTGSLAYWFCTLIISDIFVRFGLFGSVINLVLVTIERYLKICTKKKLRSWMMYSGTAFAWIGSVVYNVIAVFQTTAIVNGRCHPHAIFNSKFAKSFYLIFNFLTFYVVILFVFIFCYGRILVVIRRQAKVMASHNAAQSTTTNTQSKQIQTNVIKTMIIVSAFYAVMWLPTYISMLLYNFLLLNGNKLIIFIYFTSMYCQFLSSVPRQETGWKKSLRHDLFDVDHPINRPVSLHVHQSLHLRYHV